MLILYLKLLDLLLQLLDPVLVGLLLSDVDPRNLLLHLKLLRLLLEYLLQLPYLLRGVGVLVLYVERAHQVQVASVEGKRIINVVLGEGLVGRQYFSKAIDDATI